MAVRVEMEDAAERRGPVRVAEAAVARSRGAGPAAAEGVASGVRRRTMWRSALLALVGLCAVACGGAGGAAVTGQDSSVAAPDTGDVSKGSPDAGDGGPGVAPQGADPVTQPLQGSHQTYDVGPGMAYPEPDTVPWGALVAGDVVNIHHRAEPYRWKLGLRGQGTAEAPIVVNGVTDDEGNRPRFAFDGARTASGCNPGGADDVFGDSPDNGESLGGIVVIRGTQDLYESAPRFIQIKNLELTGASADSQYTTLAGDTVDYLGGSGGVYLHVSEDILLENLVIHGNGNGVFTMAKDGLFSQACKRITVRGCRIWGNGQVGSYREHNLYIQSHLPVVEGNFIGQVRPGSEGGSYKSRSSGEIFRYNHVVASARAVDWVYSEEQDIDGIALQPAYGTDYAYGNVIISDANLPSQFATSPIHYGGDDDGEQEPGQPVLTPAHPYRDHLYFWNNTVVFRMTQAQSYRANVFDLSLVGTTVDAWNNVVLLDGGGGAETELTWLQYAGVLHLRGTNLAHTVARDASDDADAAMISVDTPGTLITGDPLLHDVAGQDLRPDEGSPAIGAAGGVPYGVPADLVAKYPVDREPGLATNGARPRPTANDLGALEHTP